MKHGKLATTIIKSISLQRQNKILKEKVKHQTSALDSKASPKKAAETKCLPTDSANLIWLSQYDEVSSLSNRHLLQFSALWYGVPGLLALVKDRGATGVFGKTTLIASKFFASFSSTSSGKETLFFFNLGRIAFSGVLCSTASVTGSVAVSVVGRVVRIDFGCFWAILLMGLIIGFSVTFFTGTFVLRTVPKTRLCLKTESGTFLFLN